LKNQDYTLYFFDLMNTLCQSKSGNKSINSIEDQVLIPGIITTINEICNGSDIVVVENIENVAFGNLSYDDAYVIMRQAAIWVRAHSFRFCPCHPDGVGEYGRNSINRFPNPGMLIVEINRNQHVGCQARPSDILFVGDGFEDQEAAERAGIDFMWSEDFFQTKHLE